ncbi:MAG: CARDB domain-containing protein [Bdellovibrionales bacterium]
MLFDFRHRIAIFCQLVALCIIGSGCSAGFRKALPTTEPNASLSSSDLAMKHAYVAANSFEVSTSSEAVRSMTLYLDGSTSPFAVINTRPFLARLDTSTLSNGSHAIRAVLDVLLLGTVSRVESVLIFKVDNGGFGGISPTPTPDASKGFDLIVQSISMTPSDPKVGEDVTFSAVIKNIGNVSTPGGIPHAVLFSVNGTAISFSYDSTSSMGPGESRTVIAHDGPIGSKLWRPTSAATYEIQAFVDDVDRIKGELNEANNTFSVSKVVAVSSPSPSPSPTPSPTPTPTPSPTARPAILDGEYRFFSAEYQRIFGQQVSQDALGFPNYIQRYGGYDHVMSFRVVAEKGGGKITEITHQLKGNSAPGLAFYAKGNGGIIHGRVFPNNPIDNTPDMKAPALAEYYYTLNFNDGVSSVPGNNGGYGVITVKPTGQSRDIVQGEVLHLVFENSASDPVNNYFSINHYSTMAASGSTNYNLSAIDRGVLTGTKAANSSNPYSWIDVSAKPGGPFNYYYGAQVRFKLSNGAVFGTHGGFEPGGWYVPGVINYLTTITSNEPVREAFVPDSSFKVVGAQVMTAASVAGDLKVELVINNSVVSSQIISAPTADYKEEIKAGTGFAILKWRHIDLKGAYQLSAGQTAYLVLTPIGNSVWKIKSTRSPLGGDTVFKEFAETAWRQSRAQHRRNGVWYNTLPRELSETNTVEWWNWPIRLIKE